MSLKFVFVHWAALIYLVFLTSSCDLCMPLKSNNYKNSNIETFSYSIDKTWNNELIFHEHVRITLEREENDLRVKVSGPLFNSPAKPDKKPGEFFNLWDYEVAEAFFLSDSGKYLEVEFGPHGHYAVLLLEGNQQVVKKDVPIDYTAEIKGDHWTASALIPESYFPKQVTQFNAYAIHGENETRHYEALYPSLDKTQTDPDFHRLEWFRPIDFKNLLPDNWSDGDESSVWNS